MVCKFTVWLLLTYIDGLMQERRNSSVLAMELRLACINPSIKDIPQTHLQLKSYEILFDQSLFLHCPIILIILLYSEQNWETNGCLNTKFENGWAAKMGVMDKQGFERF